MSCEAPPTHHPPVLSVWSIHTSTVISFSASFNHFSACCRYLLTYFGVVVIRKSPNAELSQDAASHCDFTGAPSLCLSLLKNCHLMWVWQEWAIRCCDFNLLQPHKHWLTLISALITLRAARYLSWVLVFYSLLPLPLPLPLCLSLCHPLPSFALSKGECRRVNGSVASGWACFCAWLLTLCEESLWPVSHFSLCVFSF